MNYFTNIFVCLLIAFMANIFAISASIAQEQEEETNQILLAKEQNVEVLDYDTVQNLSEEVFAEDTVYTNNN